MESGPLISVGQTEGLIGRCPHCGTYLPSSRTDRRFSISDAMLLIAASAVSFVIVRAFVIGSLSREPGWSHYLAMVLGGLISWTPATLFLRLRRPRPTLRRLARQPGFAASLAGTSIIAIGGLAIAILALVRVVHRGAIAGIVLPIGARVPIPTPDPRWWLGVVLHFGALVGPAIIGAWLLLAISGRRRPAKGWIDPLGRILGILWIVLFVINCCARLAYLRG
jgi:hypothetical protein